MNGLIKFVGPNLANSHKVCFQTRSNSIIKSMNHHNNSLNLTEFNKFPYHIAPSCQFYLKVLTLSYTSQHTSASRCHYHITHQIQFTTQVSSRKDLNPSRSTFEIITHDIFNTITHAHDQALAACSTGSVSETPLNFARLV